jgi:probable DNA metabolism protein
MLDYLYDGSFNGLLTCIHTNYYEERAKGIYSEKEYQTSLSNNFMMVATDNVKAKAVYEGIKEKISDDALDRIYMVFLSSNYEKENIILAFLRLGFKIGNKVLSMHSEPAVFAAQQQENQVMLEKHRMAGLVRFSDIDGVLFSTIEPDHDIVTLLAPHFTDRYKNEKVIIYDKKRKKATFSYMGKWQLRSFDLEKHPELMKEEKRYRRLWMTYFENVAIKERINPKCQKRCMPVRYWKNLPEIQAKTVLNT